MRAACTFSKLCPCLFAVCVVSPVLPERGGEGAWNTSAWTQREAQTPGVEGVGPAPWAAADLRWAAEAGCSTGQLRVDVVAGVRIRAPRDERWVRAACCVAYSYALAVRHPAAQALLQEQ